jgi:hypothetical protein
MQGMLQHHHRATSSGLSSALLSGGSSSAGSVSGGGSGPFHRPLDIEADPAYAPGTARLGALGVFPTMDHLREGFRGLVQAMFDAFPGVREGQGEGAAPGVHHVHVLHIALLAAPAEAQSNTRYVWESGVVR